ncbi:MAG: 4-(cytidine 5'-diphospho)-2-C-methyl-D-erythritol kinase [Thermodesulfovibrio sp.]|nr:4-(cytidine 5'-diphospho)-2-C-methyl-D-erythritol kinase [Thermodesulfovibrio sp.]MCX7724766.1 4-(cytidine 5'-diphospho)-2-C-methyl-D-erythritol kinase [Thermodesulfovibrio sp.]MDW7971595.1 4-(cytidine 5'-diphospho)-2-C-methyl-D-erythritol kinase [Thermodesulfovibrio sp.]
MLIYKAFAKINWAVSVIKKREDGYHDIVSLIHAIDLHDTLSFEPSETVDIETNLSIKKEENLVYKAIKALQDYTGLKKGVKVVLKKEIPLGAGLGGGSSDAATTLKALNKLWKLNLNTDTLHEIGASIGSDVPFFFYLPICIVEGRGDVVKPLKISRSYCLLLVKPNFSISTEWAYKSLNLKTELTTEYQKINNNIWQLYNYLCSGEIDKICLWNDLEKSVLERYPEIDKIKKKLVEAGAKISLLTGSGSTVFGLFEDEVKAKDALRFFKGYWCRVVHTLSES